MKVYQKFGAAIFVAALIFAPNNSTIASQFTGNCIAVIDGDTIDVLHDRVPERIRLNSIDCPERSQAYGRQAKTFTAELVFGQEVTIYWNKKDRFGRTIADVFLANGKNVNTELLRAGYAWWYYRYSSDRHLFELEKIARHSRLGLWNDPHPIPPWQFRLQWRNRMRDLPF